jgi:hypothetical protein
VKNQEESLKAQYDLADSIYECYEAELWKLIQDVNCDKSLIKIAHQLEEAKLWETE